MATAAEIAKRVAELKKKDVKEAPSAPIDTRTFPLNGEKQDFPLKTK